MKTKSVIFLSILFSVASFQLYCQEKKTRLLTVTFINSYCGGARPTPEMVAEYSIPKPLTNSTICLIPTGSKSKKAICVKLDAKGEANVSLSASTYAVKMSKKFNKSLGLNYDSSCNEMLKRVWENIEIKADQNSISFSLSFNCNPCLPPRP